MAVLSYDAVYLFPTTNKPQQHLQASDCQWHALKQILHLILSNLKLKKLKVKRKDICNIFLFLFALFHKYQLNKDD